MTKNSKHRIGVSAIIPSDGRVLLVKRGKQPYKNLWSLPGGSQKLGENLSDAVIREVNEETGLVASDAKFITQFETMASGSNAATNQHFVLSVFLIEQFSGTEKAGDDASDLCWASRNEMDRLEMTPGTGELIKSVLGDLLT